MAEDWTPYALETHRVHAIRRRRIFAILAFLLLATAWLTWSIANTTRTFETGFGGQSGTVDVAIKGRKPITLEVSPGRLTATPEAIQDDSPQLPSFGGNNRLFAEKPINFSFFLSFLLPVLILAGLAYIFGRRRTRGIEEVNYGIYKGAMPLEMISASYRHLVITNRQAQGPLFGKDRADYVPGPLAAGHSQSPSRAMNNLEA